MKESAVFKFQQLLSRERSKYNGVFKYSEKRLLFLGYMENIALNRRSENVEIAAELSRLVRQSLYDATKTLLKEGGRDFFSGVRLKNVLNECESISFS